MLSVDIDKYIKESIFSGSKLEYGEKNIYLQIDTKQYLKDKYKFYNDSPEQNKLLEVFNSYINENIKKELERDKMKYPNIPVKGKNYQNELKLLNYRYSVEDYFQNSQALNCQNKCFKNLLINTMSNSLVQLRKWEQNKNE